MAENMCIKIDGKSPHSNQSSPFAITATATNDLNSSDYLDYQPLPHKMLHSSKASKREETSMASTGETEELLNSAFQELEKERTRRIELEAKLRALQESSLAASLSPVQISPRSRSPIKQQIKHQQEDVESQQESSIHSKQYAILQQELVGYRQIVDAMTKEKPAIAAAVRATNERQLAVRTGRPVSQNHCPTLPLHIVQMLEVVPWESKAQEHVFRTEEIYEWQVYNLKQRKWSADIKHFPSFFRTLSTLDFTKNADQDRSHAFESSSSESSQRSGKGRSMLMILAGCEHMSSSLNSSSGSGTSASLTVPPKKSVLTNGDLTHVVSIANGVSLPDDGGTWQWVGRWRIEKRVIVYAGPSRDGIDSKGHRQTSLDCDEEGWSYAMDAIDYLRDNPEELCHENSGSVQDRVTLEKATFLSGNHVVRHILPLRRVRRRKWTRRRVLVDYPFASEQSKHFLRLLAQNASLTVAANRISDQLVETKMKLANTQLKTQQNEEETRQKIRQLRQEIVSREERIHNLKQKRALEKIKQGTPPTKWSTMPKETTKQASSSTRRGVYDGRAESPKETSKHQVLQSMIPSWMVPSSGQKRVDSDDEEGSGCSVADDSSFSSSEQPPPDTIADDSIDTGPCRRDSVSSTGTEKSSFDWKKLGRDAMEKIKHRQTYAVSAPLVWLNPATTERTAHGDDVSCSSRSASSSSEFLQPEVSASIE